MNPPIYGIILLGPPGVGKTSIISSLFNRQQPLPIRPLFYQKKLDIYGRKIIFHIYDTADNETYDSITDTYLHNAAAAMIVYDLTLPDSFSQAQRWFDILSEKGYDYPTILVGNKIDRDLPHYTLQAEDFANDKDISFLQTSALTGEHISEAFIKLGEAILALPQTQSLPEETSPNTSHENVPIDHNEKKQKSRCS